ncbi:MAG: dihydrofolate reductase [Candidatus Bruticola sp.]
MPNPSAQEILSENKEESAPLVSAVCAVALNRVIGFKGQIPWRIPDDLANFRKITQGKVVVMGRKTFQSIGRPLPKRRNVVLSRDKNFTAPPGVHVFTDLNEVLRCYNKEKEIVFIGGSEIFAAVWPRLRRQYLSIVQADFPGDALYPEFDPHKWKVTERVMHEVCAGSPCRWEFLQLERLSEE